jgi:hypothetical protein
MIGKMGGFPGSKVVGCSGVVGRRLALSSPVLRASFRRLPAEDGRCAIGSPAPWTGANRSTCEKRSKGKTRYEAKASKRASHRKDPQRCIEK